jgi:hypothetical protein
MRIEKKTVTAIGLLFDTRTMGNNKYPKTGEVNILKPSVVSLNR